MKFFKSLLTDSQFATNDFTSESSRIESIDLADQAALSSALASYVQATAAIGSTTFDARHFNGGDLVHAIAPAAPAVPDFNRFVHDVIAPIAQTARVQAVTAFDAMTAQVVESTHAASTGAAPSADAIAPDAIPAAHAVDSTTIATPVAAATGPSTASAEAGAAVTPAVGDDSAGAARSVSEVPHASIDPVAVGTGAEGVDATTASSSVDVASVKTGTTLEATSTTAVVAGSGGEGHATAPADLVDPVPIPRPADGVDRWENHSMFSVDPTHAVPTPEAVDSTTPLANAVEAITVPRPEVHPIVGTVIIDPAHVPDLSITDSIAGASVVDSTAIETIRDGIDASKGETVTVIGSTPFPERADGLDFWENHSMFSVDPTYTRSTPESVNVGDLIKSIASTTSTVGSADTASVDAVQTAEYNVPSEAVIAHAVDSTTTLADAVEAIAVALPEVHAIVGTAIIDAFDSAKIATLLDHTDAWKVKTGAVPEVAPIPEIADGADRWENHSMFSVNPPGDDKAAEAIAETVTGETAVTSGSDQVPASTDSADALQHFLDNWLCILPVQPESLRNARLPEFTLPALSEGNTGTPDVTAITATVFDPTPYYPVTEGFTFAPVVGTEQYAVL